MHEHRRVLAHAGCGQRGDAGHHRIGALVPAGHHQASVMRLLGDGRLEARDRVAGRDHHDVGHPRHGEERVEGPAPDRAPPHVDPQLVVAEAAALPRGDQDGGDRLIHPSCGCAKIIRPATVWSTRVTLIESSLSMYLLPPSTTIIVPSSR